jgi:hypothetical protein
MEDTKMTLYKKKNLDLSNEQYMDDYESRLEQAESGIRGTQSFYFNIDSKLFITYFF